MGFDPAWYFGHRHYSVGRLRTIFADAGYSIEAFHVRGAGWELVSVIMLYLFKWVFRAEMPFKAYFERQREREFLGSRSGISNIFIVASTPRVYTS